MAAPPAARYDHATPQGGRGAPPASTVLLPPTPFDPRLPRRALKLNQYGQPSFIKLNRHQLVAELGLAYRDLRIIDPSLPSIPLGPAGNVPTTILVRERALVVNLEFIKAIICRDQVYLLSVLHRTQPCNDCIQCERPLECPFVIDLCSRLAAPGGGFEGAEEAAPHRAWPAAAKQAAMAPEAGSGGVSGLRRRLGLAGRHHATPGGAAPPPTKRGAAAPSGSKQPPGTPHTTLPFAKPVGSFHAGAARIIDLDLPYELKALEAALAEAVRLFDREVTEVEDGGYGATEALAGAVTQATLEGVRESKRRMSRLQERLRRLKESLSVILEDDYDMLDMQLTRRAALEGAPSVMSDMELPDVEGVQLPLGSEDSLVQLAQQQGPLAATAAGPAGGGSSMNGGGGGAAMALPASALLAGHPAALLEMHGGVPAGPGQQQGPGGPGGGGAAQQLQHPGGLDDHAGYFAGFEPPQAQAPPEMEEDEGRSEAASVTSGATGGLTLPEHELLLGRRHGAALQHSARQQKATIQQPGAASDVLQPSQQQHHVPAGHGLEPRSGNDVEAEQPVMQRAASPTSMTACKSAPDLQSMAPSRAPAEALGRAAGLPAAGAGGAAVAFAAADAGGHDWQQAQPPRIASSLQPQYPAGPPHLLPAAGAPPAGKAHAPAVRLGGTRGGGGGRARPLQAAVDPHDVDDVENLLETYELQVEMLVGRLGQLNERIDDTEEMVNIDLDNRRNQIVAIDLVVTSVTLMFTFVTSVSGIFGMNLRNSFEDSLPAFVLVTVGSFLIGALIFLGFMLFVRLRRLMFIPDPSTLRVRLA